MGGKLTNIIKKPYYPGDLPHSLFVLRQQIEGNPAPGEVIAPTFPLNS